MIAKRTVDLVASGLGLLLLGWRVLLAACASTVVHGGFGFFFQKRNGHDGRPFYVVNLTPMRASEASTTYLTTARDSTIPPLGRLLRRTKLDELPKLVNVFLGGLSLVGPRPDVPGFADLLTGRDRIILNVRPGITWPASQGYRDEEMLLAEQDDPERYYAEVTFPDKVRFNRAYVERVTLLADSRYVWLTLREPSRYHE